MKRSEGIAILALLAGLAVISLAATGRESYCWMWYCPFWPF